MKRQRNSFLTPLDVRVLESGKRFQLIHQFTYRWKGRDVPVNITVPAGFKTDFASIPRLARLLIPKLGRYNKAAVVHDACYQRKYTAHMGLIYYTFDRRTSDLIFLDAMADLGVAKWKRLLMYYGVRLGGFLAWSKKP